MNAKYWHDINNTSSLLLTRTIVCFVLALIIATQTSFQGSGNSCTSAWALNVCYHASYSAHACQADHTFLSCFQFTKHFPTFCYCLNMFDPILHDGSTCSVSFVAAIGHRCVHWRGLS